MTKITFGKYKDKNIENINDPQYFSWCFHNKIYNSNPELLLHEYETLKLYKNYIDDNTKELRCVHCDNNDCLNIDLFVLMYLVKTYCEYYH
eukprot:Pgem_evm3s290